VLALPYPPTGGEGGHDFPSLKYADTSNKESFYFSAMSLNADSFCLVILLQKNLIGIINIFT